MAVENITLNLIPTGDIPSIHVAQFDVDRPFTVTLKEGKDDFTPTGYDIELQVRKVDSNIVTAIPSQTSGNVVTFNTTEQMTACSGTNLAELQLTKNDQTFATLHFYLVVQRDVLAGGVSSASDIHNLTEQIAEIVPQVIGDDYYTKEEVDEKIDEIPTFDPTNYYDKSETDDLLENKADVTDLPDMTNYYDKSETDTLLSNKADKTVVDSILLLPTVKSVSGSIATFETDFTENLVDCVVDNAATTITRCGKNLFDYTQLTSASGWTESGGIYSGTIGDLYLYARNGFPIQPKWVPNQQYVFKLKVNNAEGNSRFRVVYTDNTYSDLVITSSSVGSYMSIITEINKTISNLIFFYNVGGNLSISEMCLELGNTATTFESYNGQTYAVVDKDTITTLNGINNIFADYGDISIKYLCSINYLITNNGYIG